MSLCQTCIACIEGTRRPLASYSPSEDLYECHHHDRLADLQEAAASGCPLCTEVCEIERYFKWLTDDEAAKVEQEGELLECHITHGQKRGHRDEHYSLYFFYTKRVHPIVRSFERGAPMVGFYFWPSDGESMRTISMRPCEVLLIDSKISRQRNLGVPSLPRHHQTRLSFKPPAG